MSTRTDRDDHGIPHLWADTATELAYLQGRNAATDRAWQIEVERWRSQGRLAERVGAQALPWDRFARRVRLDDTARRCYQRLAAGTRRWVAAYVAGVNDALPAGAAAAPEFAATGTAAGQWRPWSPLGVFLVQHILFGSFPHKLWRAQVAGTLGPAAVDLCATEGPGGSGSNAWAVTGDHTPHGAPIIAGDPHRVLELPGVYQQIRLACPEFDVIGLAFPGVPGLPHFGHAGPVAWAITNAMADYQDLYREQLRHTGGRVLVREPAGWTPVPHRLERIAVRGAAAETVEVVETPRGTVIDHDRHTGEAISLRLPARVESGLGFGALLPLLRARTVGDVTHALRGWVEPVNSVLVADTTGAVHRLVAGLVPVRDRECHRWPVPGWEPRYGWRGYAELPSAPVRDLVVNANDRRPADVAELGTDFAPPHRARRIRELLAEGADAADIHRDTRAGSPVLRRLLGRVDPGGLAGPARALRDRLLAWDGDMRADSTDAGAYAAWRGALARLLYEHPCLRPLHAPSRFDELFTPWTDPLGRIGLALDTLAEGLHRLGGDVLPVAAAALAEVADGPPPERWGKRHVLHPVRVPTGAAADPAWTFLPAPVGLSGDTDCVLATSSAPGASDVCWRGPVARYVWDLADRDNSRWIVPFGPSGRPGDRHFADQLPRWAAGELIPVPPGNRRPTAHKEGHMYSTVYEERLPGLGQLRLVPLDPDQHIDQVYRWVTEPRAQFWGMTSHTREQVREIYEFLAILSTHHAYLIHVDETPVGIFQTYQPAEDPVGDCYPVRPGDIGIHLFVAAPRHEPVPGFTGAVTAALFRHLFRDPAVRRIVIEPDVRNERALRRWRRLGFTFDAQVDLAGKRAQLAFLTRGEFGPAPPQDSPDRTQRT